MRVPVLLTALTFWLGVTTSAPAQFKEGDAGGAKLGETKVQKLRVGVVVNAVGGSCTGIAAHMAVPTNWPEQEVRIVEEDVSPSAKVSYRMIDGMAKAMVIRIPFIRTGDEAKAIVTFEVRRRSVLPPDDTGVYVLPDLKKLDRDVRLFLAPSPKIESQDRRIRAGQGDRRR